MNPLTLVIVLALVATVVVLATGIVDLIRGEQYEAHSARMMYLRVVSQGIAFLLVLAAMLLAQ